MEHKTYQDATSSAYAEAMRLGIANPGQQFVVLQAKVAYQIQHNPMPTVTTYLDTNPLND